jgi:hypothetical protein
MSDRRQRFRDVWRALEDSKLLALFLGFLLTVVAGSFINNVFQQASWEREKRFQQTTWEREKRFELLKRRLDAGTEFLDRLSDLMNRRVFGLQRFVWAVESGAISEAGRIWPEYYQTVIEWNRELNANRSRVLRLVGDAEARDFLEYGDEQRPFNPTSIHGRFKLAHDRAKSLRDCMAKNCPNKATLLQATQEALRELDIATDSFVERSTETFLNNMEQMELLK